MKKASAIILIILLAISGVYASGQAPRTLGDMHGRLIGQWSVRPEQADAPAMSYYFAPLDHATGKGAYIQTVADAQLHGSYTIVAKDKQKNTLRIKLQGPNTEAIPLGQGIVLKPGQTSFALPNGKRLDLKNKLQERVLTIPAKADTMRMESEALIVRYGAQKLSYINAKTTPEPITLKDLIHRARMFLAPLS